MLSTIKTDLQHGPYHQIPARLTGLKVLNRPLLPEELRQIHLVFNNFMDIYPYNRISLKHRLLAELQGGPYGRTEPDDQNQEMPMGGGCVDMCLSLRQLLPPELPFCVIPSVLPERYSQRGLPALNHAALALVWKSYDFKGFRLLVIDPGFSTIFPLISLKYFSGKPGIRLPLDIPARMIDESCHSEAPGPGSWPARDLRYLRRIEAFYQLTEIINPVEHIMNPFVVSDLRPSIVFRSNGGDPGNQIKIHLKQGYVQMRVNGRSDKFCFTSSFLRTRIHRICEQSRCDTRVITRIADQVMTLVQNRNILCAYARHGF